MLAVEFVVRVLMESREIEREKLRLVKWKMHLDLSGVPAPHLYLLEKQTIEAKGHAISAQE